MYRVVLSLTCKIKPVSLMLVSSPKLELSMTVVSFTGFLPVYVVIGRNVIIRGLKTPSSRAPLIDSIPNKASGLR